MKHRIVAHWRKLSLISLVALALLAGAKVAPSLAQDPGNEALIERFLGDYVEAFTSGNPFPLSPYDPGWKVFGSLIPTAWFDEVRRSSVELTQRSIAKGENDDIWTVSFVKTQEDLLTNGLLSRGVARVSMELKLSDGTLTVLWHRTAAPSGNASPYLSNSPKTWGKERPAGETALYLGLELLKEGDTEAAARKIEAALLALDSGPLPQFLLGKNLFEATAYYAAAVLAYKQGDAVAATANLEAALEKNSDFPSALNLLAQIRLSEGSTQLAQQLLRTSLSLNPRQEGLLDLSLWLNRSLADSDPGNTEKLLDLIELPPSQAIQTLSPMVKRRPRDAGLVALLAKAYWADGELHSGLEILQNSGKIGKDVEVSWLAARFNLRLGNTPEAQRIIENLWSTAPAHRDTLPMLVASYGATQKYSEAIARLNNMTPASSSQASELAAVSALYNLLDGRYLDAVEQLRKASSAKIPARLRTEVATMMHLVSSQGR